MGYYRRDFLKSTALLAGATMVGPAVFAGDWAPDKKIRVLVWDERQPAAKEAYGDYLGNYIAMALAKNSNFEVKSVALDDDQQGISTQALENTDVLIWWGHIRHGEVPVAKGVEIAQRIIAGKLHFIGLHSAHWSNPFVEAMNAVTQQRVYAAYPTVNKDDIEFIKPALRMALPLAGDRLSPYIDIEKFADGRQKLAVHLPNCCFPYVADEGKPTVLQPKLKKHPVLKGLPAKLTLAQTEMYGEPFHVPEPDELLLEEYWGDGKWFRSGMLWRLGKGRIFYFRPGHEAYPIFKESWVIQLLQNAVFWLVLGK